MTDNEMETNLKIEYWGKGGILVDFNDNKEITFVNIGGNSEFELTDQNLHWLIKQYAGRPPCDHHWVAIQAWRSIINSALKNQGSQEASDLLKKALEAFEFIPE